MWRKIVAGLALFAALTSAADAGSGRVRAPQKLLLLGNVAGGGGSTLVTSLNFSAGAYSGSCSFSTACLSITRASSATDLLPSSASGYAYNTYGNNVLAISPSVGLLIFEARTNQLLNSIVPVTQTTASLAPGVYTLWVNGSGSATMSTGTGTGCGTGAATNGTAVNFTVTVAGTCTVTVAGSLNFFQLELGAFGTSGIVTAGATATRAGDTIMLSNSASTTLSGTAGAVVALTSRLGNGNAANSAIIADPFRNTPGVTFNTILAYNGAQQLNDGSTANWVQLNKIGFTWSPASARQLVLNGGTVSSDAFAKATSVSYSLGSLNGGGGFLNGALSRLDLYSSALTSTQIQAATQ